MTASAERRAFGHYLRTGWREAPGPIEFKFNSNHDPANGRFTFGSAGHALRSAVKAARHGTADGRKIYPVKLKPLTDDELATVHALAKTRAVTDAMEVAWRDSLRTGRENGVVIYYDGEKYYPGKIIPGIKGTMTDAFWNGIERPDPLRGRYGHAVAVYHTHPDTYPGADRADNLDQNFGMEARAITIIRTHSGWRIGT